MTETLADKIQCDTGNEEHDGIGDYLTIEDVREAVRDLLCPICLKSPENNCSKCNKLKKRFGEKLI